MLAEIEVNLRVRHFATSTNCEQGLKINNYNIEVRYVAEKPLKIVHLYNSDRTILQLSYKIQKCCKLTLLEIRLLRSLLPVFDKTIKLRTLSNR